MNFKLKIFAVSVLLSFIILFSPLFYREFSLKTIHFDFKKSVTIPDFSVRTARDSARSIAIADNSLINRYEFQTQTSTFPSINSDIDDVWHNDEILSNTHELYVHSLYILWDLLDAFKSTGNEDYLHKGIDIIESWISINHRWNPFASQYVWWDHSTSERTIAILTFVNYSNNKIEISSEFYKSLNKYSNYAIMYLSNPQNYIYEHNHGIFEDISLLLLTDFIIDQKYVDKYSDLALKRFYQQANHAFSDQGIHLENSPGYHLVVTRLCDYFIQLATTSHDISEEISGLITQAKNNEILFKTPTNRLAEIGDTNWLEKIDWKSASEPFQVADSLAGYYINYENDQYLFARTQGFLKIHGHSDVLSFIYSTSDGSLISETGFLNYVKSADKDYTKTPSAHNSIIFSPNVILKGFIRQFGQSTNWSYANIEGLSGNTTVTRSFFMNKRNTELYILDQTIGSESNWTELIHLSHDIINHTRISDSSIQVELANNSLYEIESNRPFNLIKGKKSPKMGWKAIPFDKLIPSLVLEKINPAEETISLFHIKKIDNSLSSDRSEDLVVKFNSLIDNEKLYQKGKTIRQKNMPNWGTQYFRRVEVFKYYLIAIIMSFIFVVGISRFIKHKAVILAICILPNILSIMAILYVVLRHIN